MRLGVIDGPGHHGPLLIEQLTANHHAVIHTHPHPRFSVLDANRGVASRADRLAHDAVRRVVSAAQYRLRRWAGLRTSYDFDLYTRLYAKLSARYLDDAEAVIGFSMVCYDALQRAKALGHPAILEIPSSHLLSHTEIAAEEYHRAGQAPAGDGITFSRFAIERACQEYAQADLIQVLSAFAKKTLVQRGVSPEKIIVTPLGIDVGLFEPNEPEAKKSRPFRVLFVGRLELVKGVRYLLEAFGQLRLPDAELWLIGAPFLETRPFLEAHPRGVTLLPPMPQAALAAHYRNADVLVFPTLSDGMGLVMLEAMACGVPVIATDHSGAPEIIREGTDGFIVPIRDSEALAERILRLYQDPEACITMGRSARARVEAMFTRAHYGERLERGLIAELRRFSGRGGSAGGPLGSA